MQKHPQLGKGNLLFSICSIFPGDIILPSQSYDFTHHLYAKDFHIYIYWIIFFLENKMYPNSKTLALFTCLKLNMAKTEIFIPWPSFLGKSCSPPNQFQQNQWRHIHIMADDTSMGSNFDFTFLIALLKVSLFLLLPTCNPSVITIYSTCHKCPTHGCFPPHLLNPPYLVSVFL